MANEERLRHHKPTRVALLCAVWVRPNIEQQNRMGLFGKSNEQKWAERYAASFIGALFTPDGRDLLTDVRVAWNKPPSGTLGDGLSPLRLDVYIHDSCVAMLPIHESMVRPPMSESASADLQRSLGELWLRDVRNFVSTGRYKAKLVQQTSGRYVSLTIAFGMEVGRLLVPATDPPT